MRGLVRFEVRQGNRVGPGERASGFVMAARAKVIRMDSPAAPQAVKPDPVPIQKRYQTLLEVAGSVVSQVGLSELFRDLLQHLKEVGGFDFLNLVLHDPARKVMRLNVLQALNPVTIPMSLELPVG